MKTFASAVLCAFALTACGPELETEDPDELRARSTATVAPTYALKTTAAKVATTKTTSPVWATSYPISSTYTLYFATDINGTLSGRHRQSVFVFMPDGSTYQHFDVAFATDVAAGAGEQQAEKTSTGWRVWVAMPVAGTMIESMRLVGGWNAAAYIDGAAVANAGAAFQLN